MLARRWWRLWRVQLTRRAAPNDPVDKFVMKGGSLHFSTHSAKCTHGTHRLAETSDDSPHSLVLTNEGVEEPSGWACIHLGSDVPKTHNSE